MFSEMSDIISAKVPKTATETTCTISPRDCASVGASAVHMPGFLGILSECQFSTWHRKY